jgi:hypothetical protein
MGYSKYPTKIDGSNELPPAVDNVTPVKGEVVNRQRDALLAIENELGVDPSAEYGTVRARLDAMELGITGVIGTVTGGTPTTSDKDLTPSATSGNYAATGLTLSQKPLGNRYVTVRLNGIANVVGDGVRTEDCYFSRDGGATALSLSAVRDGDQLYWNGNFAGMNLETSDSIDFDYDV